MALLIDPIKCTQDHKCLVLNFCPSLAISQIGYNMPIVDAKKCFECRNCTYYCPNEAIVKVKKPIKELQIINN